MPLPTLKGHQFYLPSPEAYLLTLYTETIMLHYTEILKLGKSHLMSNRQTGGFRVKGGKTWWAVRLRGHW